MTHKLKVRWALAAAIARSSHVSIDDQKGLRIARNDSDGKTVIVRDPNDQDKTIVIDLDGLSLDSLKFWTMTHVIILKNEPLVDYYERLCFNLVTEFSDEQGLLELKESIFKAWEEDAKLSYTSKNTPSMQMDHYRMFDTIYSASLQMRDILDDSNFRHFRDRVHTLAVCATTVACALRERFRLGGFYLHNIHPELPLILDTDAEVLARRICDRWLDNF